MLIIKNKLRILSAVILAIASSATILSSCGGEEIPEIPVETVIGTQGEILGVSVYTEENKSETLTVLYEITTKKAKAGKTKKADKTAKETSNSVSEGVANKSDTTKKLSVLNDSSEITLKPRDEAEKTSRVRVTFPKETTQKNTRVNSTFVTEEKTKHVPISYVPEPEKPRTTKKAVPSTVKQTQIQTNSEKEPAYDETVKDESNGINLVFKTNSVEKGTTASIMIQGKPGEKYSIDFYTSPTETADYSDLADQTADENGLVTWTFSIPSNCSSGSKKIIVKEKGSDNYIQTSINVK